MCGIAGILRMAGTEQSEERRYSDRFAVGRMVEQLRHRGPDGVGVMEVCSGGNLQVTLGHTRLAIIDVSAAGQQPMSTPDRAYTVTFNGEIYNYRSLRREIGGEAWASNSDTEVLLQAYVRSGRECLRELRGMFAFAVWDERRRELLLARDRLGIKPLYYYRSNSSGLLVFASEVRALLASGLVPRHIDVNSVWDYLGYQSVPAPRTIVKDVWTLNPGSWLSINESGDIQHGSYWDLLQQPREERDQFAESTVNRRVAQLLEVAVESHLVSDVPVGAFLSGGIDSTAIVGLMRQTGHSPHTFTVSFAEHRYNEASYARLVADRFRAEHTEILLREKDMLSQLPDAFDAMDQPTGDGVNTFVVARAVRENGIKVALSGVGGDELFAGYPAFKRLGRSARLFKEWGRAPDSLRALVGGAVRRLGLASVGAQKVAAMLETDGSLARLHPLTRQVLSVRQRVALLDEALLSTVANRELDPYVQILGERFATSSVSDVIAAISYAEARTYMHDVLLRDTDQMSMAHGLEVRIPFLDHQLAEYVVQLPDAFKRPNGTPKRLLVESLRGLLPDTIVHRPKQGFTLPFDAWLRSELRDLCSDRLGPDRLGARGIFRPEQLTDLWTGFLAGQSGLTWSRVWVLVVLEEWLQRNQLELA